MEKILFCQWISCRHVGGTKFSQDIIKRHKADFTSQFIKWRLRMRVPSPLLCGDCWTFPGGLVMNVTPVNLEAVHHEPSRWELTNRRWVKIKIQLNWIFNEAVNRFIWIATDADMLVLQSTTMIAFKGFSLSLVTKQLIFHCNIDITLTLLATVEKRFLKYISMDAKVLSSKICS